MTTKIEPNKAPCETEYQWRKCWRSACDKAKRCTASDAPPLTQSMQPVAYERYGENPRIALFTEAQLAAAVAEERERCIKACSSQLYDLSNNPDREDRFHNMGVEECIMALQELYHS